MAINWKTGIGEIEKSTQGAGAAYAQVGNALAQQATIVGQKQQQRESQFFGGLGGIIQGYKQYKADEKAEEMYALNKEKVGKELKNMDQSYAIGVQTIARNKQTLDQAEEEYSRQNNARIEKDNVSRQELYDSGMMSEKEANETENATEVLQQKLTIKNDKLKAQVTGAELGLKQKEMEVKEAQVLGTIIKPQQDFIAKQAAMIGTNAEARRMERPNEIATAEQKAEYKNFKEVTTPRIGAIAATQRATNQLIEEYAPGAPKEKDGQYGATAFGQLTAKVKDMKTSSPEYYKLKYGFLNKLMNNRLEIIGSGAVSDGERMLMTQINGAGLPNEGTWKQIIAKTPEKSPIRALFEQFAAEDSMENNLNAYLSFKNDEQNRSRDGVLQDINTNSTFSAVTPRELAEKLYVMLPEDTKANISLTQFKEYSRQQILDTTFGQGKVEIDKKAGLLDIEVNRAKFGDFDLPPSVEIDSKNPTLNKMVQGYKNSQTAVQLAHQAYQGSPLAQQDAAWRDNIKAKTMAGPVNSSNPMDRKTDRGFNEATKAAVQEQKQKIQQTSPAYKEDPALMKKMGLSEKQISEESPWYLQQNKATEQKTKPWYLSSK